MLVRVRAICYGNESPKNSKEKQMCICVCVSFCVCECERERESERLKDRFARLLKDMYNYYTARVKIYYSLK